MECPLIKAAAVAGGALIGAREMKLLDCSATCAWWVGAGKGGNSGCAIAFLGDEAALKRYQEAS